MKILAGMLFLLVLVDVPASQELLVSRKTAINPRSKDTTVTVFRYDKAGFKVSEVTDGQRISDWDSQGRYLGSRGVSETEYYDKTVWVTADSTLRYIPVFQN